MGMGDVGDWGDGRGRPPGPLVLRRIWPAGGQGWRNRPPAAWPTGNAAGAFGPMLRVRRDMPAGRCFGDLFLRVGKGLRTTRRMRPEHPVPRQTSGAGMGARGSPRKRALIPAVNGRAFEGPARFGQRMGWLAQKPGSRGGPDPRAMVWLSLRVYSGPAALRYAVRPRYSDRDMAGIRRR